jgi:hypothetical protein
MNEITVLPVKESEDEAPYLNLLTVIKVILVYG